MDDVKKMLSDYRERKKVQKEQDKKIIQEMSKNFDKAAQELKEMLLPILNRHKDTINSQSGFKAEVESTWTYNYSFANLAFVPNLQSDAYRLIFKLSNPENVHISIVKGSNMEIQGGGINVSLLELTPDMIENQVSLFIKDVLDKN